MNRGAILIRICPLNYKHPVWEWHSKVISYIYYIYCNSSLSGCSWISLKNFEFIQNSAARVITAAFQILLLTYKSLNNQAPSYLQISHPNTELCSWTSGLFVVPPVIKSRMEGRAFSFHVRLIWNQLPVWIWATNTLYF